MNFLIDTCVISEIIKPKPSKRLTGWLTRQDENDIYLSVLTLGEIQKGIEKLTDIKRKRKIHLWVEQDLKERFKKKILPIDTQVAMIWGQIQGLAEKKGRGMPTIDGLIAATAIAGNLVVVTRNIGDMKESGVALYDPWTE